MKQIPLLAFSILILSGCAHPGPVRSLLHAPDRALITGNIRVIYNQFDCTEKSSFLFCKSPDFRESDPSSQTSPIASLHTTVYPDSEGFILAPLPLGCNSLIHASCLPKNVMIRGNISLSGEDFRTCLETTHTVYYIGDITLHWTGPDYKDIMRGGDYPVTGMSGPMFRYTQYKQSATLEVTDRFEDAKQKLQRLFPDQNMVFKKALLPIHPAWLDQPLLSE